ncbi:hypothetical protein CRG98_025849, partial [Punica granatum]
KKFFGNYTLREKEKLGGEGDYRRWDSPGAHHPPMQPQQSGNPFWSSSFEVVQPRVAIVEEELDLCELGIGDNKRLGDVG